MIDYAYEDLETEAVKEREEHERYEAECANAEPKPFEPTPTKAQKIKDVAEATLIGLEDGRGPRVHLRELTRIVIRLADAIDERLDS